jgi:hypothetical protein
MPATSVNPRLLRFAILAAVIAVIAVGVAMCGPSNNSSNNTNSGKPTVSATPPKSAPSAAPPPAPPPPEAKDYVEGLVESVSGNAIQLRTRTGSAVVDFSPSTRVVEQTPAQLTDVTPGSCVNVRATPQSAPPPAAITAQSVTITSAIDGKCPPPAGFYGTVTSVSGSTIAVSGLGPGGQTAPTNVTVANSTTYNKQTASTSQAIAHGRCMGAQGTNSGGALQAMTIALQACPPFGRPHHHLHIPHLHLHL